MSNPGHTPIGSIPSEWNYDEVGPHVDLLTGPAFNSDRFTDDAEGTRLARGINITRGHFRWDYDITKFWPEMTAELAKYLLRENDVIIGMDGSLVGRNYALVLPDDVPALLVQRVARLRTDSALNCRFLFYFIASDFWLSHVDVVKTNSGIPHISNGDIRRFRITFPPSVEQHRIAEILSTLDEAIERTEGLIGKLQQIKAGLMHDLCTRGVTPAGHLRPPRDQAPHLYKQSPLGWIPNEWEVKNLGTLAEIVSGVTLGSKAEVTEEVGVPYLRVANVQDGYFDLADVKTIRVSRTQFEKLQLRFGDVLMNEGGDFDKLGRGSVWEEEIKPCIHQNHVFRVRPRDGRLRSYYLAFWSQSEAGKKYFVLSSKQSTNLASINSTQLNRFPISLPPATEQERIETRIFAMNDRADSLTNELAKLRQQKHGLMHDLLTGRVRVPVAAAAEGGSA